MKRFIILLALVLGYGSLFAIDIIPEPTKVVEKQGSFRFLPSMKVYAPKVFGAEAEMLSSIMETSHGYTLDVISKAKKASIVFEKVKSWPEKLGDEGYRLTITPDQITIQAKDAKGAFYAVQSIRQLLPVVVDGYYSTPSVSLDIPCCEVEDSPMLSWRGYMLDCSRYFVSVDRIKKHLDLMALYKMNVFQWHLTDYQGWRLQIMKYPELTKVGSTRNNTIDQVRGETFYNNQTPDNGFYSQEQVKELVKYAEKLHITIVPEIDVPAHSIAAIAAYPEISCSGNPAEVRSLKIGGMSNVLCPGKEVSFQFVEDVLDEVFALFPSKIVHIGGDEVKKDGWKKCPHCRARMEKEGLKDYDELQCYFISRVAQYAKKRGHVAIGWDEILEGGIDPNAMVMSWRGEKGGIKAAKMHHKVVMSPNSYLYFDYLQSTDKENEPYVRFKKVLTLETVYGYNPIPASLNAEERKFIVGAQANMWGNFTTTPAHYEYMTYPRLCALAEATWTPKKNYKHFESKLEKQYKRFDEMHVAYRRHDKQ
ncbi:beta-N-acetylhexosaminidase [Halosquirtibacter xylanolyticus]|uniref:beta-N-acetylhexosaminidase n=1 Tax=Halosquirtibacter xylanolyticus TaxID=3374599 RepID=UPI00374A6370|nr:beta-N-acetylhexosaminidase [Prolixibacteraceae bacterium]